MPDRLKSVRSSKSAGDVKRFSGDQPRFVAVFNKWPTGQISEPNGGFRVNSLVQLGGRGRLWGQCSALRNSVEVGLWEGKVDPSRWALSVFQAVFTSVVLLLRPSTPIHGGNWLADQMKECQ